MKTGKEPRINLLRYRQEELSAKKSNLRFNILLGLVVLLFLGAVAGAWWTQNQKLEALNAENQQLQQEVDQLTVKAASIDSGEVDQENLSAREALIKQLTQEPKLKAEQVLEVYELSDPGITIGNMSVKAGESVTMSAYCSSQADFIKFLDRLRSLDYIKEVKNVSSKRNAKTGEVNFNITLVWGVK